jgi:hypothetical protein
LGGISVAAAVSEASCAAPVTRRLRVKDDDGMMFPLVIPTADCLKPE